LFRENPEVQFGYLPLKTILGLFPILFNNLIIPSIMKKFTFRLLILCLLFVSTKNLAQCVEGVVVLNTQLAVNNFMATIPTCALFTGSLNIGGPNSDISDLSPLSTLTGIMGNLRISNCPLLTNLQGLHNLTTVEGNFTLSGFNFPITTLNGLSGLQSVEGIFEIEALQSLTSMDGLTSLTSVGANFIINNCNNVNFTSISVPSLASVGFFNMISNNRLSTVAFSGLATVGANFNIVSNALLANANFSALEVVGSNLLTNLQINAGLFEVRGNTNLVTINFSSLTTINGQVDFIQNSALQNLGFQNLNSIKRGIRISSNPLLSNIDGLSQLNGNITSFLLNGSNTTNLNALSNVTSIGVLDVGDLILQNNPLLTDISGLSGITIIYKSLQITNNDALLNLVGLNTLTEIATSGLLINDNDLLANIDGLENLTSVGVSGNSANIQIINNSSLISLGLSSLTSLKGSLIIQSNPVLTDVSAINLSNYFPLCDCGFTLQNNTSLQNLMGMTIKQLNGAVQIIDNPALQSIDFTLTNPSTVRSLVIDNNTVLQTISGLGNVSHVNSAFGTFRIFNNDSLENLNGLGLTSVVGSFVSIRNNDALVDVNGLLQLTSLGTNVAIEVRNNAALLNVDGFKNISSAGRLFVQTNPMLQNVDGFSGITQFTSTSETRLLSITDNLNLESIQGIRNIIQTSVGSLSIFTNPKVAVCDLKNICQFLATSKTRVVFSNQSGCNSVAEIQSSCPTIWNGSAWSDGVPNATRSALIEGNLDLSLSISAKNFTVNSGFFKILSDVSLNVSGSVVNNLQPENFIVENNGNLIQPGGLAALRKNNGAIKVYAENAPFKRLDYTLWSAPVKNQNLFAFSPATINGVTNYIGSTGRIYTYEGTSGYVNATPFTQNDVLNPAKGYLFRAPNNWSSTVASVYEGQFIGEPNNGNIVIAAHANNYTSIGNPYPSTIDALELFGVNPQLGALYFWTNTNAAQNGSYSQNNYASYTTVGGVAASGSGIIPTPYIGVGQGFIAYNNNSTTVTFTNDLRSDNATNFFRTATTEKSRFWLDLKGENEVQFNQILLSYMSGATDGFDHQVDGKLFAYEGSSLYSIIENEKYSIQAKGLPFADSDVISLGFKAENAGIFTISLGNFDGLFSNGNVTVFLKDNQTNTIHNLMQNACTFQSDLGTFNERFQVVYQATLGLDSSEFKNSLLLYKNQNQVLFKSSEEMQKITIYDLLGRIVYNKEGINDHEFQIDSSEFGKQILLISVESNGVTTTQKLVN
jgi:hypothetical protein